MLTVAVEGWAGTSSACGGRTLDAVALARASTGGKILSGPFLELTVRGGTLLTGTVLGAVPEIFSGATGADEIGLTGTLLGEIWFEGIQFGEIRFGEVWLAGIWLGETCIGGTACGADWLGGFWLPASPEVSGALGRGTWRITVAFLLPDEALDLSWDTTPKRRSRAFAMDRISPSVQCFAATVCMRTAKACFAVTSVALSISPCRPRNSSRSPRRAWRRRALWSR